jgi:GYF domain 2
MKKYYLHDGKEQKGPFDIDELTDKNISRETSIWFEGLEEWKTAEKIDELKSMFSSAPPLYKAKIFEPPPIHKIERFVNNNDQQPIKSKNKIGKYILILLLAIIIIFVVIYHSYNESSYSGQTYNEQVMSVEETENSQPTVFLAATGDYNENFWGTKLKVHGIIRNNATVVTYKDAVVKVTYFSKTKTELGNMEYTIYEVFPPQSTKNFELKIENYKDVNSIGWEVVNAISN